MRIASIKNILSLLLLAMISQFYIFHEAYKPKMLIGLSVLFVILNMDGFFSRALGFMKFLIQKGKDFFSPHYLNQLSIRKILFPKLFAVAAIACFVLLWMGKICGSTMFPKRRFGLFLPVFLLSFSYISILVVNGTNVLLASFRRWFLKKIYRRNAFLTKTYIIASYVLAAGLVVAYSFFVFKSSYYRLEWYFYDCFDKRGVYFTYLLLMVGFLFFPYFYSAFVRSRSVPALPKSPASFSSFGIRVAGFFIGAFIAIYFWGPPWNTGLVTTAPDAHEVVHLGPLLAIKQGKIPYSEAPIQYGPGVQLFQYLYMNSFGFDLLHLRESFLVLHFAFAFVFFVSVWSYLKFFEAMIATLFCFLIPTALGYFGFGDGGDPGGFFGWAVGFRYLAPPFLALAMAYQFTQARSQRMHPMFAGCVYGFFLYMAQENLSCGILTLTLGSMLAVTSKCVTPRELKRIGLYFFSGMCLSIAPVLGFYASHRQLGMFLGQYFKVASAVIHGFSNTPWSSGWSDPLFLPYVLTPVLLFFIGVYALYFNKKSGVFVEKNRLRLLFIVISAITLHQVSLFRADSTHFGATCLALPIVFGLLLKGILTEYSVSMRGKAIYSVAVCLLIFLIYPATCNIQSFKGLILRPSHRYFMSSFPSPSKDDIFFKPFGFYRNPESQSSSYTINSKTSEFISEMNAIKQIVGDQPTIVDFCFAMTSGIYFFADLNIGTRMIESYHSVINSQDRRKFIKEIRSNRIKCFITNNMDSSETQAFLRRFPEAAVHHRMLDLHPYYILCDHAAPET